MWCKKRSEEFGRCWRWCLRHLWWRNSCWGICRSKMLPALIVLAPMYGGGALLIREVVRRTGRGWPSILLLGMAYAILEEAFTTQSLFNPNYLKLNLGLLAPAYIPALGMGAWWTLWMLMVHGIWSISTPIALIEACVPDRARTPWLGQTQDGGFRAGVSVWNCGDHGNWIPARPLHCVGGSVCGGGGGDSRADCCGVQDAGVATFHGLWLRAIGVDLGRGGVGVGVGGNAGTDAVGMGSCGRAAGARYGNACCCAGVDAQGRDDSHLHINWRLGRVRRWRTDGTRFFNTRRWGSWTPVYAWECDFPGGCDRIDLVGRETDV